MGFSVMVVLSVTTVAVLLLNSGNEESIIKPQKDTPKQDTRQLQSSSSRTSRQSLRTGLPVEAKGQSGFAESAPLVAGGDAKLTATPVQRKAVAINDPYWRGIIEGREGPAAIDSFTSGPTKDDMAVEDARQLLNNPPKLTQRPYDPAARDAFFRNREQTIPLADLRDRHTRQQSGGEQPADADAASFPEGQSRKSLTQLLRELQARRATQKSPLSEYVNSQKQSSTDAGKVLDLQRQSPKQQQTVPNAAEPNSAAHK
jgi:hypothetical protein